jgi:hypothetical protein
MSLYSTADRKATTSDIGGKQTVSRKIERERAFGGLTVERRAVFYLVGPRRHTKALNPVMDLPTISVFISLVPS